MPILPLLWANRELIAKGLGILLIAFFCYWFFWHNPKVIAQLKDEVTEANRQIVLRDNAINLLGTIERTHDEINKGSAENEQAIRNGRKPRSTGMFIHGGLLPSVFANYSAR